ncbi:AraC family transcriptional regulator [Photobacterium sp. WH77]|uniref:AraC family transcriptional regulator n=1 Tax=Photobacterium arenosum TaxID=2774143 RepID=A0ABR9BPT9_9GAMM|nr:MULTISPECIES: AraC family transcriptional regulator [Photobacterium]MBD8514584.1 AraC family transcriptional regulator [Photobacterium arenosum]MCG2838126.1 AraC family transcriptional regulator [Photobacterium sp. WH77]MCG2845744.1 AraC family transcriptional regulator [Photobacterium sp. WH80]
MNAYYSTLSGWLIPFSRMMAANQINEQQALSACGISPSEVLHQESRIGIEKITKLLQYCNQRLPRQDVSVQVARNFHPSVFYALGYAMMSSSTLKDALERIARYKRVVSNTCSIELIESAEQVVFRMNIVCHAGSHTPVIPDIVAETFLATMVQFARDMVPGDLHPVRVCLMAADQGQTFLSEFMGCEILYGQAMNAVVFDSEQASRRLITGNSLLAQTHEKMLDEFLTRMDKNDLIQIIRNKLCQLLPMGVPTQTEIAESMGISLRSLQRKLQDKGTSFTDILESTRKKLALEYIEQPHLSLGEIGYLVGYSSVGNFNRAFKRWTEETPGRYRNQLSEQIR